LLYQFINYIKTFCTLTDRELIQLWQDGNELAFEHLYNKYAVQLLAIAVQKTNDREISKELVQHTFITLFNNKVSAHEITSLMAYLYTILKNRMLTQYRHNLIHKKYEDYTIGLHKTPAENSVQNYVETKELEQLLSDEIQKLSPMCQKVFRLRRERELSNKQIAFYLKISENTVEQHMRKALRILKIAFQIGQRTLLIIYLLKR